MQNTPPLPAYNMPNMFNESLKSPSKLSLIILAKCVLLSLTPNKYLPQSYPSLFFFCMTSATLFSPISSRVFLVGQPLVVLNPSKS